MSDALIGPVMTIVKRDGQYIQTNRCEEIERRQFDYMVERTKQYGHVIRLFSSVLFVGHGVDESLPVITIVENPPET